MNFSGKFGSADTIWYPAAGSLYSDDGGLSHVGSNGYWWSCTPSGYCAYYLRLYSYSYANVNPSDYVRRTIGLSVRCLQE